MELDGTNTAGKTQANGVWFVVGGDYKPGRVTTTVTDLVVRAPGLPIQIQRTYDSLVRSTSSDFAYGWSLGIRLQVEIANNQDVTFTINGQRRTFYFTPQQVPLLTFFYNPQYTAEPGFYGPLQSAPGGPWPPKPSTDDGLFVGQPQAFLEQIDGAGDGSRNGAAPGSPIISGPQLSRRSGTSIASGCSGASISTRKGSIRALSA